MDPFRLDDLEGWRQLLHWIHCLLGRPKVSVCEALRLPGGSPGIRSREGVFVDVGEGSTLTRRGVGDKKTADLGTSILTSDEPLPMPKAPTMNTALAR